MLGLLKRQKMITRSRSHDIIKSQFIIKKKCKTFGFLIFFLLIYIKTFLMLMIIGKLNKI